MAHPAGSWEKNKLGPERPFPLPFLDLPEREMAVFDPVAHQPVAETAAGQAGAMLPLALAAKAHPELQLVPRMADCELLWERYAMPEHIRRHSLCVAELTAAIAVQAKAQGALVSTEAFQAAGLLHDLGKAYSIAHGGSHAQTGAAWVMRETRNGPIARAVLFHVCWPWERELDVCLEKDAFLLPLALIYADKRVKHDADVGLEERFADLYVRYGVNQQARDHIHASHRQAKKLEAALSRRLGVNLHEHSAYSGRLVK